ncbi:hypothetical protein [Mesorhizobium muleiense]|uniref:Uncharacterized protein n=1 Tax=Mesorhizobium muleiense TaxID=1004279 RepID=A0A1G9ACF0_9HYPH|nr:hypothetical protein [Mesorhizobium muleiense]MCF6101771.1 hypothetical protein [Mesorhizobium muleiense]SDK24235.1 hypothetical protein SAMN05428953_11318 [Mesorhizobium muleiense]
MADPTNALNTYVFKKEVVLRSIGKLEQNPIHEHFAGYLAILRAQQGNQGLPIHFGDIAEFHEKYLRVIGASDRAPYVRPFKSRGQGLEAFNSNVAGSYAPGSLRSKGKLIEVIKVVGERQSATYTLRDGHASLALDRLLKGRKVPIGALTAFLYRDYGFRIDPPNIQSVVALFRSEFGLAAGVGSQKRIFDILFADDLGTFKLGDLELLKTEAAQNE